MFGLGFGEVILVLVVALLVLGPEKLPKLAKTLGKGMREFRRAASEFQQGFNEMEQEANRVIQDKPQLEPAQPPADPSPSETISRGGGESAKAVSPDKSEATE